MIHFILTKVYTCAIHCTSITVLTFHSCNHRGGDDSAPSFLSDDWSELKEREESRIKKSEMLPRYEDNEVYNDVDIEGEMMAPPRRLNYEELSEDDGCQSDPVSGDVVAEAKYRLRSLEREAEVWKNYM